MTTEMDHAALISRDEVERRAASVLQEYGLDAIPVDPLVCEPIWHFGSKGRVLG